MQSIEFPALIFNSRFIQGQIKSESDLCIRTFDSVDRGFFDQLKIVGSDGRQYVVSSYVKSFRWRVLVLNIVDMIFDFFTRPRNELCTWIEFSTSEPEQVTFDQVKAQLSKLVNNNPGWYKKLNEDHETIDEKLQSYKSLEDLITSLAGYPD